jgi:hypothetical protein
MPALAGIAHLGACPKSKVTNRSPGELGPTENPEGHKGLEAGGLVEISFRLAWLLRNPVNSDSRSG